MLNHLMWNNAINSEHYFVKQYSWRFPANWLLSFFKKVAITLDEVNNGNLPSFCSGHVRNSHARMKEMIFFWQESDTRVLLMVYYYMYMVHNMYVSVVRDKMLNLSVISLA